MRAEAYYEDDMSRFAESYKRQFAAHETESLKSRTRPKANGAPVCECLVALDDAGSVVGCIDVRLPFLSTGARPSGVPESDDQGCYLLNVVVAPQLRGQGVGKALMREAMRRAAAHWAAQRLYTHVQADNEVAYRLYLSCGFQEHSSEAKYAQASTLGRLVLLIATSEVALA